MLYVVTSVFFIDGILLSFIVSNFFKDIYRDSERKVNNKDFQYDKIRTFHPRPEYGVDEIFYTNGNSDCYAENLNKITRPMPESPKQLFND